MVISGERELPLPELRERAARAASGFRRMGIAAGDVVALMLRNDFPFLEASLAAPLIGAYTSPINWHFGPDEAGYVIADSRARVVVAHADLLPRVAGVVPPDMRLLVAATPAEIREAYSVPAVACALPPGAAEWDAWVESHEQLTGESPPLSPMIYTSGTTGRPKGVRRAPPTPEQAVMLQAHYARIFGLHAGQPAVVLMTGPMYHAATNSYAMTAVRCGATIVLQPRFDAEETLALIESFRISHMHMVPTMFVRLLRLPDAVRRKYDLSSLRFVVHGAAPCAPAVKRAMIEWWGPVINEYYGSTETGSPVWHSAEEALRKPGTVGRAVSGAIVKVYDDAGVELEPGEIGELYLRLGFAPDFTYHGQDARRREIGRGDLVTVGDVGWIDDEGYVFLCDRRRDVVIAGGVNIYPAEIELALGEMPGVKDCAVFGVPDDEFGERLCACVEPEPMVAITPESVRTFLASRIAGFKIPKLIEIVGALPRDDSGKIFKSKLRAPYWEKAGRRI